MHSSIVTLSLIGTGNL